MRTLKEEFIKTALIGFFISFLVIFVLYEFIHKIVIQQKVKEARNIATTIIYYRDYLATISPYVKIVNPHISPFSLTPAYATNQVVKNLTKDKFYIKQVSDNYRNPIDKPKPFELKAIEFFKTHKNENEYYKVYNADQFFKEKYVFYARKLVVEKSCLRCHGVPYKDVPAPLYKKIVSIYGNKAFNYKLGDVRGILSIVFPYQKVLNGVLTLFGIIVLIGGIFFLIGLFIFFRLHNNIVDNIQKVLNHFTLTKKGVYPLFKDKMNYLEFEDLKNQINRALLTLKRFEGLTYKKHYFNDLTLLPNRAKFLEFINKNKYIIVLVNMDKFKDINFYFGPEIGNKLIMKSTNRLRELKRKYKFKLFHIDIDEFALLFNDVSKDELIIILKDILSKLEKPYNIDGNEIVVRFRAGVSFYKKEYLRANIALDLAKELKKDIFFAKEVRDIDKYKNNLEWLRKIKKALEEDNIELFYQPIVNKNKEIVKYESLVRLKDEEGKIIPPFYFLEIAKKSRLYLEITRKVITKAIETIKNKNVALSINLTLEDIESDEIRNYILEKLKEINPKLVTFEIVESEDVRDSNIVKEFVSEVKELGALIYIDDFGTGYSNFDYLVKLHPDGVKIDGSLIKNILHDENAKIMVKTIISFAKEMKMDIVAEYIENEEVFEFLKSLGVDYFQGYYFSESKSEIKEGK